MLYLHVSSKHSNVTIKGLRSHRIVVTSSYLAWTSRPNPLLDFEFILSSTRSILSSSSPRTTDEMSLPDQGKTHSPSSLNGNTAGFRPANNGTVTVQPPRREDLQPSYAQVLHGDDVAAHGFYGSMSKSQSELLSNTLLIPASQFSWSLHWLLWRHSGLHRLPEPLQASQPGKCRSSYKVRPILQSS